MHALSLKAFARKPDLGGGFRAVVIDRRVMPYARLESDVLPTYEAARDWCISRAHQMMGDAPYRRASVNAGTAGKLYQANIWIY